nr:MAG TPA: hypothetical protein [Caudoviricetes sp.]
MSDWCEARIRTEFGQVRLTTARRRSFSATEWAEKTQEASQAR